MLKKCLYIFSFLLLINLCFDAYAQKDTVFWFAAPAISDDHSAESRAAANECGCNENDKCGAAPVSVTVTNSNNLDATILISMPANAYHPISNPFGFPSITQVVPAQSARRIQLWNNFVCDATTAFIRSMVESRPVTGAIKSPLNKGLKISSVNSLPVTVYYEVEETNNSDIFPLKGENGLGDEFFCVFETYTRNNRNNWYSQNPFSSINIVAADAKKTYVYVDPKGKDVLGWSDGAPFTFTLDQGQTMALLPGPKNATDPNQAYRDRKLTGTYIKAYHVSGSDTTSARIAITLSDDSVYDRFNSSGTSENGCYDLVGDQTIPINKVLPNGTKEEIIGSEYIIMKGGLAGDRGTAGPTPDDDYDRVYCIATKNNTQIAFRDLDANGNILRTTNVTINQSEEYYHEINVPNTVYTSIVSDQSTPFYVLHTTGGGGGCEIGGSILPAVSKCTGSKFVGFSRGATAGYNKEFLINIMFRELSPTDAEGIRNSFVMEWVDRADINTTITESLNGSQFKKIAGTTWWAAQFQYDDLAEYKPTLVYNTNEDALFHLGVMNGGSSNGGNYGYFSNYGQINVTSMIVETGGVGSKLCLGDTINLYAASDGGNKYKWEPSTFLSNDSIPNPFSVPRQSIIYKIIVTNTACNLTDTAELEVLVGDSVSAEFILNRADICAPDEILAMDKSFNAEKYSWYLDNKLIYKKGIDTLRFNIQNKTNSPQIHELKLYTNKSYCYDQFSRFITVYPEIDVGFDQDTLIGCHPLDIQFIDTSFGIIDSSRYTWNFGDNQTSVFPNPAHTFRNLGKKDTTYTVKLKVSSPYLCVDSAKANVIVYPYIHSEFTVDSTVSCSPMNIQLNPLNSVGVDTFYWNIYDHLGRFDTLQNHTSKHIFNFTHTDTSQNAPDTILASLVTVNRYGCKDTATIKKLVVYPEVYSIFEPDKKIVCDSTEILFANHSTYSPIVSYQWDFGDNNSANATSNVNQLNRYYNRTSDSKENIVRLIAKNIYTCADTSYDTITVHPYINALFSMDFDTYCSPVMAEINNRSVRSHINFWKFGDGIEDTVNLADFVHRFENPSESSDTLYQVKLISTNNEGCSDSVSVPLTIYPIIAADFEIVGDTAGCNPLTIGLKNNSKGLPGNDFLWIFDNGFTSSTSTRDTFYLTYEHEAPVNQQYELTLKSSDLYGCDSTISKTIEVYSHVESVFSINRQDSCAPFAPVLSNHSSAGATQFTWNYGDNTTSTGFDALPHTYKNTSTSVRSDTLTLEAKNNEGCTDIDTAIIKIYPEIQVSFTPDITEDCQPTTITHSNQSNIKSGATFTWDFGDGTYLQEGNGTNQPHQYTNNTFADKIYTVKLHGITQYGCQDSASNEVIIYRKLNIDFQADRSALCPGEAVFIKNESKGATNFSWHTNIPGFEDYGPDSVFIPNQGETFASDKTIKLIGSYKHCKDSISKTLRFHNTITTTLEYVNQDSSGCHPFTVSILNLPLPYNRDYTFNWNFGESGTSNDESPQVTRTFFNETLETKKIPIRVHVIDTETECEVFDSINVYVHPNPRPSFEFLSPVAGCAPFGVKLINTTIPIQKTLNEYVWNFGNKDFILQDTLAETEYVFENLTNESVSENISLTSVTAEGCRDSISENIIIYPHVISDFEIHPDTADCSPFTVEFDSKPSMNADKYTWKIENNVSVTTPTPKHVFVNKTDSTLIKQVRLIASSDHGCKDTIVKNITVFAQPDAFFYATPIVQYYPEATVEISNITPFKNSWNYEWNFGEGQEIVTTVEPDHTYKYWGKYTINVHVYNDFCESFFTREIEIIPAEVLAGFETSEDGCVPLTVEFKDTSTYGHTHVWLFDDGSEPYLSGPGNDTALQLQKFNEKILHTFYKPGDYNVVLQVDGEGGTNYSETVVRVYPKPIPDFAVSPQEVFLPDDSIQIHNFSKNAISYFWDFGDNNISYENEPFHLYTDLGEYEIMMIATSPHGCLDTITKAAAVKVKGEGDIIFPDAFMPNLSGPSGGEYNLLDVEGNVQIFHPKSVGVVNYKLEIYDRWGALIFISEEINIGWDGYIDDILAPQDVYIYRATGTFTNEGSFTKVGNLTLLHATPEYQY